MIPHIDDHRYEVAGPGEECGKLPVGREVHSWR
jgi:hypothetical protein